ncbi:hypothetical protein ACN28I_33630 [Archangium gephyra]|uniref:hypothetical protein n=1 Tax=Archangium gephyra TaxID=48 RepID=UPI003B7F7293
MMRFTSRKAVVLTASLCLLLACGGGAKQEGEGRVSLNMLSLPDGCSPDKTCGNLTGVDCRSAVDGPYYYVETSTGRVVETCGGACMAGPDPDRGLCMECPPRAWTCD